MVVTTRCYSQFCPRELKLEYFSPHTVVPAVVACSSACWMGGAQGEPVPPCPCVEAEQTGRSVPGSPHTTYAVRGTQWQGGDNAVGKVQKKYVQESRNFSLPTLGVCTVFWTFGQHGRNVCRAKTGMKIGFHFPLNGNFLDNVSERLPQVSVRLDFNFRFCRAGISKQRLTPKPRVCRWKFLSLGCSRAGFSSLHLILLPRYQWETSKIKSHFEGLLVWCENGALKVVIIVVIFIIVFAIIISLYIFSGN